MLLFWGVFFLFLHVYNSVIMNTWLKGENIIQLWVLSISLKSFVPYPWPQPHIYTNILNPLLFSFLTDCLMIPRYFSFTTSQPSVQYLKRWFQMVFTFSNMCTLCHMFSTLINLFMWHFICRQQLCSSWLESHTVKTNRMKGRNCSLNSPVCKAASHIEALAK